MLMLFLVLSGGCKSGRGGPGLSAPCPPRCSLGSYGPCVSPPRQSYDISIVAQVDQTGSKSSNLLDLKNPFFR